MTRYLVAEQRHDQPAEDEDDTMESRFVQRLLKVLLNGFVAKDKSVRFRSCALVAKMVSYMGELEYVPNFGTLSVLIS